MIKQIRFISDLKQNSSIINATISSDYPGSGGYLSPFAAKSSIGSVEHLITNFTGGFDFLKTFDIKLMEGRDFMRNLDNKQVKRVILNQTAVRLLDLKNPVGKHIITRNLNGLRAEDNRFEIVGVVKDFNFESLHSQVKPIAISLDSVGTFISIRIQPGNLKSSISAIESCWKKIVPGIPFEYTFAEDQVNTLYKNEQSLSRLLAVLTALIIVIASFGLFGLTLLVVQQRSKEIAIRKVMGANVVRVLWELNKDYIKLSVTAILFSYPCAYFLMNSWLQNFAYKTDFPLWLCLLTCLSAFLIAVITVSYQTIKASLANPVKSLRTE